MDSHFTKLELVKHDKLLLLSCLNEINLSKDEEFNSLCSFLDKEKKTISKYALKVSLFRAVYEF